jgi:hypothetical protein
LRWFTSSTKRAMIQQRISVRVTSSTYRRLPESGNGPGGPTSAPGGPTGECGAGRAPRGRAPRPGLLPRARRRAGRCRRRRG